jgi:hypothetical protein
MKASHKLADIFRTFGPAFRKTHRQHLPLQHLRVMHAIETCRTPHQGGHVYTCDHCGETTFVYHSCRNRHCPTCQFLVSQQWLEARKQDLLPIPYFHVVFTLPKQLRPLALRNQKVVYNLLFKAASQTLRQPGADPKHPGARIGFIAILHTWSQTLMDHPHLHCIVTGGGLSPDRKQWIAAKDAFFISVRVLSTLFRGKFLAFLKQAWEAGGLHFPGQIDQLADPAIFRKLLSCLYRTSWNVYCKPPFGGPQHVLAYLSAYTHRIAISNNRILRTRNEKVYFHYRDSANDNQIRQMALPALEFIRRFLLHALPKGFVRIRHYGLLSNRCRKESIARCRTLMGVQKAPEPEEMPERSWQDHLLTLTGIDVSTCPHCGKGKLILTRRLLPKRAPPDHFLRFA